MAVPTSDVSIKLGFHARNDTHAEFQATMINNGKAVIANWSLEMAVPRFIVSPETIACFVPEMSDTRRAVFRTTPKFCAEKPLWPRQSYTLNIPYVLSEQTAGARNLPVRATGYVDSVIAAEDEQTVENLSIYFAPAVVARREATRQLMERAQRLPAEFVGDLRKKKPQ